MLRGVCTAGKLSDSSPGRSETRRAILFRLLHRHQPERTRLELDCKLILLSSLTYRVHSVLYVSVHFYGTVFRGTGAVADSLCLVEQFADDVVLFLLSGLLVQGRLRCLRGQNA